MITEAQKQKILGAVAANRANYPSDAKHAASLGISTSVYSAIKNGPVSYTHLTLPTNRETPTG